MNRIMLAVLAPSAVAASVLAAGNVAVSTQGTGFSFYAAATGPDAGEFRSLADSALSVRIDATSGGGEDVVFSGLRQVLTGTLGAAQPAIRGASAPISNASLRLENQDGVELFTISFGRGTFILSESPANVVWTGNVQIDPSGLVAISRGPLLDDAIPAGDLSYFTGGIDARIGFPSTSTGTITTAQSRGLVNLQLGVSFACRADFNNDRLVDDSDFIVFARAYDEMTYAESFRREDMNDDRFVADYDFVQFAAAYDALACP